MSNSQSGNPHNRISCSYRYRNGLKERTLNCPACLLVYFAMPVGMCIGLGFNITFSIVINPEQSSCWAPVPDANKVGAFIAAIIQACLYFVLYPLVGWLADTVIGRGSVIKWSLLLCWFGTLLQIISYCIQYGTCGLPVSIAKYGISLVALLCLIIGTAGYQTNILAYGLDQLSEKSNTHIRAFVHWIVWAQYVGFLLSYIAFFRDTIYNATLLLVTGIVIFTAISFAVVLSSVFSMKFEPSGTLKKNPYTLVYRVLKYTKEHKYPTNRSSLTYWENEIPSRINYGKAKFGGPFSEDDVEAVKTFLRIVAVFVSAFGFYIPHYVLVNGALPFVNVFEGADTINGYGSFILWNSFNKSILIFIPLLELFILPLFPKIEYFLCNPLKSIAVSYVLLFITLVSMFILDTVGHSITSAETFCFLVASGDQTLQLSYYFYSIPFFFASFANIIAFISFLEFICSQAPVNMSGMLTGVFYLIRGVYTSIGPYLQLPFSLKNINGPGKISCSFWILLVQIIICITGTCVYLYVMKWYSRRRRGEDYFAAKVIEEKYDNYFRTEMEDRSTESIECVVISS